MKHYGDVTKINGAEVPKVDVITFGAPCQDLSVAGKRAGMKNVAMGDEETTRSGLFFEAIRIIKEMRHESFRQLSMRGTDVDIRCVQPRYAVYENVPGAFSSNGGEDFRAVLEETAKVADENAVIPRPEKGKWTPAGCIMGDGWSIAWRVHDAQFWGVPQRRKRIALVADFGGSTAPEILFEREGVSGDSEPCGTPGKETAGAVGAGVEAASGFNGWQGITSSMPIIDNGAPPIEATMPPYVFEPGAASRVGGHVYEDDVAGTVRANAGDNQQAVVCATTEMTPKTDEDGVSFSLRSRDYKDPQVVCYRKQGHPQNAEQGQGWEETETNDTLNAFDSSEMRTPTIVLEGNGSRPSHRGDGYAESETMYTLNSTEHHAVLSVENHPNDSRVKIREDGTVQTLSGRMGTGGGNVPMVMEPVCIGNGQTNQSVDGKAGALNCMHDQQAVVTFSDVADTLMARDERSGFHTQKQDRPEENCVCYGLDRAAYNQGKNAKFNFSVEEEKIGAQVAKGPGAVASFYPQMKAESQCYREDDVSNTLVNGTNPGFQNDIVQSVVRRLTPMECERLQGYPSIREVKFTEMTKDEYIAWNINEGHIVVDTEYGKVFATRGPGGVKLDEPRELTGSVVNGYKVVNIRNGETKMMCRVHRIVWIAEHGIIPDGYVIDHINNDKQDNRRCNLQLLTAAENSTKARADGLYKVHGDSDSAKISDDVHDLIQYVYGNTDLSIRQLSEIFGISKSRVQQIIHDDHWTDIGEWVDSKGKKHKDADSPRYKALGNSIALPFWQWMAERMVRYIPGQPTMASLFDGIGGFPLVFSRCGCDPIWASEIEEFPMAVTRLRFPE